MFDDYIEFSDMISELVHRCESVPIEVLQGCIKTFEEQILPKVTVGNSLYEFMYKKLLQVYESRCKYVKVDIETGEIL